MAEGLTRLVTVEWLRLSPVLTSYDMYVAAYRALATVLDVDAEYLWRLLWGFPPGQVSAGLVPTVERILNENSRGVLSRPGRSHLAFFGTRHFSSDRANDRPNEQMLVSAWRSVIE